VGLSAVAARLEPKEVAAAAGTLTETIAKTNNPIALASLADGLSAALGKAQRNKRAEAVAAAVGCLYNRQALPGALLLLGPATEPFQCRLSDQELVELLKHPLCVGLARRAVLDHLEMQHRRTFADQWEFVRYAQEQQLDLDFTTPPQRPEPPRGRQRPIPDGSARGYRPDSFPNTTRQASAQELFCCNANPRLAPVATCENWFASRPGYRRSAHPRLGPVATL
jgi:hypothetical protein